MTVDRPPEPQFDESPPDPEMGGAVPTASDAMFAEQRRRVMGATPGRIAGRRADMSVLDIAREQTTQRFTPSLNRQRVQAAVAFHLGGKLPGVEWTGAVDPIANRFLDMAVNNPQLVAMLEEDVNTLFALTDEDIAARISRGEPVSQLGDVFDAIAEVSWEVGATDLAARFNAEQADAMSGTFDALTSAEALDLVFGEVEGEVLPGARFSPDAARAATFQKVFDVSGAWSFSPSERTLAVTVGSQTIGVQTRPGFDPQNHLDVMAEVVSAQADGRIRGGELTGGQKGGAVERIVGAGHEFGGWLDEHPGVRRSIDDIWDAGTRFSLLNIAEQVQGRETGQPLERASDRMRDAEGEMTAESVRLASVIPFPEDAIIASVARQWVADSEGELTSKDALALAAETVAEGRSELEAEYDSLTAAELFEELESDAAGESALGTALESGLGSVLTTMQAWDDVTQWIGVNVLDFVGDYLGAADEISSGDWEEGFARFKDMLETQEMGTSAAEYFGLEGAAADAANLAVGIGFDPLNLVFAGGKGIRQIAYRALVQPEKYAGIYLKMGQFPHIANQIVKGGRPVTRTVTETVEGVARETTETVAENTRGVMGVLSMSGLDTPEVDDLLRLALDPDATVGQVNAVWTRALKKDWLGEGPMRAVRRNTVEGLGRALDAVVGGRLSREHLGELMQVFSKLSSTRTFRLGENQAADRFHELLIQFFPADPERAAGLALRASAARRAAGDELAMRGSAEAMKEQARRTMSDTSGPIHQMLAAADPRAVNQNLLAVEDALTRLHGRGFDEATEAALRTELNRMHAVMSRRVDDAGPRLADMQQRRRTAHQTAVKATAVEADSLAGNASRNAMADQVYRLYDEVAQDLNVQFGREVVPVVPGKMNPFAPDVPVRDWSEITGTRGRVAGDDPDLALMMGLSADDAELARQADAAGMLNKSQHVLLPASPYEVILFQKIGHDQGLVQAAARVLRGERVKRWTRIVRLGFAFNLIANPLTAGRVTLDETWRFLTDTGNVGQFARSTLAGIPGLGRVTEDIAARVQRLPIAGGRAISSP